MVGRGPAPGADRTRWLAGAVALAAAAAILLLSGCGGSDDDRSATTDPPATLSVLVEPATTRPGEKVEAAVTNDGAETYTYGAAYELERRAGDGWRKVRLPPRPVIQIAYVAEPGAVGPPVTVAVPADAKAGRWRVVIDRDAPGAGLLAGEFEVAGENPDA